MSARNPIKDKTAIVGVGTTTYSRESNAQSQKALTLEACRTAVRDAGLTVSAIDGLCGANTGDIQAALGIPALRWFASPGVPVGFQIIAAMNAVYAGACETVLVYHSVYRNAALSKSASKDPIRQRLGAVYAAQSRNSMSASGPESIFGAAGYASWASRYIYEFGATREDLGRIAINSRTNAGMNEHAVMRTPLTMEGYLAGRMIREPLCIYDMDLPIDGADAFLITSAERARDLRQTPIFVHAATLGQVENSYEDQIASIHQTGQNVVFPELWNKSDIKLDDVDIFFPYDGFTFISLLWIENAGFCARGEAGAFLVANWDALENRIRINGKTLVNTHGGSLSEGGTQGAGQIREAILQLRGAAGNRQVTHTKSALLTIGGIFFNSQGLIFRAD